MRLTNKGIIFSLEGVNAFARGRKFAASCVGCKFYCKGANAFMSLHKVNVIRINIEFYYFMRIDLFAGPQIRLLPCYPMLMCIYSKNCYFVT